MRKRISLIKFITSSRVFANAHPRLLRRASDESLANARVSKDARLNSRFLASTCRSARKRLFVDF